ncbi:uncharacterized protein [Centruroides vittatus]|uniref:uncharacterized protein n=1 Tax=Centruroides vittatus TaxID=120091 RepID=UPI00350F6E64
MNRGHMKNYFISLPRSRRIKCLERLVIMRIADDSIDVHDVLVLEDKYYIDPYLIPTPSLQYVAIQILEMVRYVQDNSGSIDSVFHRFDDTLLGELITYLDIREDSCYQAFRFKIVATAEWLKTCYDDFRKYAPKYINRRYSV